MTMKPSKSRRLFFRRGVRNDSTTFIIGGQKIPLLFERSDPLKAWGGSIRQSLGQIDGESCDDTALRRPGKDQSQPTPREVQGLVLPVLFMLCKRVMWPLKMSEIPLFTASKMDEKANSFIRKWLGLPRWLSETGLFGMHTLQLLL